MHIVSTPSDRESFAQHMLDLYKENWQSLTMSNTCINHYVILTNDYRNLKETSYWHLSCEVSPKDRFQRTNKNLHARQTSPYWVPRKKGTNAYELELSQYMGINPVFNFEGLTPNNSLLILLGKILLVQQTIPLISHL